MGERRGRGPKSRRKGYLPLTFWDSPITVTRHERTFKVGRKTNPKKMREAEGNEPMAQEYSECHRIQRVVANIEAEIDRTLPLLWDKW